MAFPSKVDRCKFLVDDWTHPFFKSLVDPSGKLTGLVRYPPAKREKFLSSRTQKKIQTAARELLETPDVELVRTQLVRHLELAMRWGRIADKGAPEVLEWRQTAKFLFGRACDVSTWLMLLGLPRIIGVDWDKLIRLVTKSRAQKTRLRRKTLDRIALYRDLIEKSVFDPRSVKRRRPRTRPGDIPWYIHKALILLKQSEGKMSARKIARELGCDHSIISKHQMFKDGKRLSVKAKSSVAERLEDDSRRAYTSSKSLLTNEKTDTD